MMKFTLSLVILAALLPCMLAFNIDRLSKEYVLRKWLDKQMIKGQSSND